MVAIQRLSPLVSSSSLLFSKIVIVIFLSMSWLGLVLKCLYRARARARGGAGAWAGPWDELWESCLGRLPLSWLVLRLLPLMRTSLVVECSLSIYLVPPVTLLCYT